MPPTRTNRQAGRASSDLYELIRSMNPTEKRHFRLYAQKGSGRQGKTEENRYVRLFDILEGQPRFDDEAARKKLGIASVSGYARIKNYLYSAILDSLEDYYRESTVDARFFHALNQAGILKARRLYDQSAKMYRKALKLADDKGVGFYRLLVERVELDRLTQAEDFKGIEKFLEDYEERKLKLIESGTDHIDLQMIKAKLTYLIRYAETGIQRHREWLTELADHPLLREVKHPDDLEYRLYYDNLNGLVHGLLGNKEKDHFHRQSYLQTYQDNPEYIQRWPANYIVALGNVAEGAADVGDYSTLLECTAEMRDFLNRYSIKNRKSLDHQVEVRSRALELMAWEILDVESRQKLYEELRDVLIRQGRRTGKLWRYLIRLGLARYEFEAGDFSRSLDWIRPILQEKDDALLPQNQLMARLLSLLCHFELGNHRIVESSIPSVRNWIRKRRLKIPIANQCLKVLTQCMRSPEREAKPEHWQNLSDTVEEARQEPDQLWLARDFDWNWWINRNSPAPVSK